MTEDEQTVASQSSVALDMDVDPNEIVCRKVRVGSALASRLKAKRCKTRAEYREEDQRSLARMGRELDDINRREAVAQSLDGWLINATERAYRPR